jgi:hypothetical protein
MCLDGVNGVASTESHRGDTDESGSKYRTSGPGQSGFGSFGTIGVVLVDSSLLAGLGLPK